MVMGWSETHPRLMVTCKPVVETPGQDVPVAVQMRLGDAFAQVGLFSPQSFTFSDVR
jgi:hypothetical protein